MGFFSCCRCRSTQTAPASVVHSEEESNLSENNTGWATLGGLGFTSVEATAGHIFHRLGQRDMGGREKAIDEILNYAQESQELCRALIDRAEISVRLDPELPVYTELLVRLLAAETSLDLS